MIRSKILTNVFSLELFDGYNIGVKLLCRFSLAFDIKTIEVEILYMYLCLFKGNFNFRIETYSKIEIPFDLQSFCLNVFIIL